MTRRAALPALLALLSVTAPAAAEGGAPGVYWEQSIEMQMAGFSMPAQTIQVCMPKGTWEEPPKAGPDDDCQLSEVKRTGSRMTWKVRCKDGTSGTGDLTYAPASFQGTMIMQTGGQTLRMAMKGKKVGGDCDAEESKRRVEELQQLAAEQQAQQAELQAQGCADAVREMDVSSFHPMAPGAPVLCPKESAEFCRRLETREGLVAFRRGSGQEGGRQQAERVCRRKLADVEERLCAEAAAERARGRRLEGDAAEFVFASCPEQARAIAQEECAGRSFTSMPEAQREFCTRYAREQPDEGEPARPAALPIPDVKRALIRGLFGR